MINWKFKFTVTPPPSKEEFEEWKKLIGDYVDYINFKELFRYEKKKWVPRWLWRLVSEVEYTEEKTTNASIQS